MAGEMPRHSSLLNLRKVLYDHSSAITTLLAFNDMLARSGLPSASNMSTCEPVLDSRSRSTSRGSGDLLKNPIPLH
jgi:hypothetical protein